jgi:isopentenyl-diphosphate delta-isomerase
MAVGLFSSMEQVILVNAKDEQIGTSEKLAAHKEGKLHRAFSIIVENSKGEMLLQRRALSKYHCGGLWANTCCGHPRPGENLEDAAHRRLREEMGFDCALREVFSYTYNISFENGLTEHEFLHVFVGVSQERAHPNPDEVMEVRRMTIDKVFKELRDHPEKYAYWFHQTMARF